MRAVCVLAFVFEDFQRAELGGLVVHMHFVYSSLFFGARRQRALVCESVTLAESLLYKVLG